MQQSWLNTELFFSTECINVHQPGGVIAKKTQTNKHQTYWSEQPRKWSCFYIRPHNKQPQYELEALLWSCDLIEPLLSFCPPSPTLSSNRKSLNCKISGLKNVPHIRRQEKPWNDGGLSPSRAAERRWIIEIFEISLTATLSLGSSCVVWTASAV